MFVGTSDVCRDELRSDFPSGGKQKPSASLLTTLFLFSSGTSLCSAPNEAEQYGFPENASSRIVKEFATWIRIFATDHSLVIKMSGKRFWASGTEELRGNALNEIVVRTAF